MNTLKSLKTPLRYPGGKSRSLGTKEKPKMGQYFPNLKNYTEYREPFLGGGSVAIHISKMYPHLKVTVNDLYEPLINFWVQLQQFGDELTNKLKDYKINHPDPPKELRKVEDTDVPAKELFLNARKAINNRSLDDIERAAAFYIANKCSFSGLTENASFSKQASYSNFTMKGIEKLPGYSEIISHWHINQYSYEYCFREHIHDGLFMYLDPPYDIKDNLYGGKGGTMHKGFDHDKFAEDCSQSQVHQLISYNSDQLVKDRFKGWNAGEFDLTYTMRSVGDYMRNQKTRKELLLFNYEKTLASVEVCTG